MSAAAALLAALEARQVRLEPRGARLACVGPEGVLTDADRLAVAEHRAELVALLAERTATSSEADADADADARSVQFEPDCALLDALLAAASGARLVEPDAELLARRRPAEVREQLELEPEAGGEA